MSSPLREERCWKCRFVGYCFFVFTAQADRMIVFLEIFRRQMWARGMGQLRNIMWILMDHNYSGCMTTIYNDRNDNHDGHHCCKCCLMISWPDFRCRPSLCKASWTLNRDIKSADATWHHMMLAPRHCIWTNFTLERNALRIPSPWRDEPLFCQVKGATGWSWSMQHLNSSFFQRCHHWNEQTFYPSICL